MGYDPKEIEQKALEAIKKHKLVFFDDIVCFVECGRSTLFNLKLDKMDSIKEALAYNKLSKKKKLRDRWEESENATLQISAYKLIANKDELARLNKQEHNHTGQVDIKQITGMEVK